MHRLHSSTRLTRRALALVAVGIVAMTAVVLLRDQGRAGADEVSLTLNRRCELFQFGFGDFDIPLVTNDTPEPVAPGGQVSLSITTGLPQAELEAIVNGARGTFTIPAGLTLDGVTFAATPGTTPNFTGSYTTSGNTFVLHYAADPGGVLLAEGVLPTATATFTVSPTLAGTTINWQAPTSIDADIDVGIPLTTNCVPNRVEPLINTTPVSGTATSTTTTTTPANPWQALIDVIVGIIRFLVCLFTGVC